MTIPRVWTLYEPKIFTDLINEVFQSIGLLEPIGPAPLEDHSSQGKSKEDYRVDVIVLPLDENDKPMIALLPMEIPEAKLVAFSPDGRLGMRLLPGSETWEEMRPFGLAHLLFEVLEDKSNN